MAITLDATLAAAQDLQNRKPLCRILSKENVDPIPFVGELLSTATPNEQYPTARVHSTGRMFVAFAVDAGGTDVLRYGYTDAARTFFTWVDFTLAAGRTCGEVAFCEMADTYVGLVWEENYGGTRTIKYRKVTVTGVDPAPAVTGTILTNSTADYFTGPAVAKLADNSYMLVYGAMDGTDYKLYYRTSADFVTWAAAGEVDLSTLTSTQRKANPALLVVGSALWLLFDYVETIGPNDEALTNIYYVTTSDKFVNNSAAAALTTYTDYAEKAEHPAGAINTAGHIYLAFDRLVASLQMDDDSTGWCGAASPISNMHIDVAAQKLYAVSSLMGAGNKTLYCVVKIDLATWTIDKCWSTATVPAFPAYFANNHGTWYDSYRGDGFYVPVGHQNGMISVLNAQTDTIRTYCFYDFTAYGNAKNVTWTPTASGDMQIAKSWIDAATDRLYVALIRAYTYNVCLQIGWIDLTAAGPDYAFTTIVSDAGTLDETELIGLTEGYGFLEVNTEDGWIIVGMEGAAASWKGCLRIYDLATGGLWKEYTVDSNPSFPYRGLKRGVWNSGLIVGSFTYEPLYGQADYRGLCIIDTATDVVTYNRPSWASVNDYGLKDICLTGDDEYVLAANGYGVTLFDGTAWTLHDNASLPGLTPSGEEAFLNPVVYNPTTRMIIAGHGLNYGETWSGLVMFSRDGYIKQANYRIGTLSGAWSWGTIAPLVQGYTDYAASIAFDPDDDSLYAFWTNQNGTELSIKWDKEMPAFDLSNYIVRGTSVERSSTLDPHTGNWDADLSFEVKHGHLFDASNGASLLRQYLAKGRKIEQQFGDTVGGVDYYETARHFTISNDGELDYERGVYPVMSVEAETPRRRWQQIHIVASEAFNTTPENIIASLLEDYAGILPANISLGSWPNSATVEYQFVDVMLGDAVNQIAYHFGYAIRDGAGGIIEAVKITNAGTVTRAYSDNSKLVRAAPRNALSSFTNRWTVRCEERTFTELLMAEELAAELNASHRWNTGRREYKVNYTQGSKIYRNPRLEVVETVSSLMFALAGNCSEELIDNSHNEADQLLWDTYCTIIVDSPDLLPQTVSAMAALLTLAVTVEIINTLPFISAIRIATWLLCIFILNNLAATGNFYYRVYGQPVVKVRRQVQATADDTDSQVKMGQIISDAPYDDPLCGSAAECQTVADFLKMVGMGERARWSAERVADLHDEEGDIISVIHPFSGQVVTTFLTDLKTTFLVPEESGDGALTQEIEGWRI